MKARLVCADSTCSQPDLVLSAFPVLLGRGLDADLQVRDECVSRAHCVLDVADDVLFVHDAGSRNGTFVNESPVQTSALQPGDTLRVGLSRFRVVYDRETSPHDVHSERPDGRHPASPDRGRRSEGRFERAETRRTGGSHPALPASTP